MIIGITGGTGAGKTTALEVLESFGAKIIDCDKVYHELLDTSVPMRCELFDSFPDAFEDGKFLRKKLGFIVFQDKEALKKLNAITDKYVIESVDELTENEELSAIDAISLIESGLSAKCDVTVCVLAPTLKRIERIMERDNVSFEYAKLRVTAQKSDDFYRSNCNYTLMNDSSEGIFRLRCEKLFSEILGSVAW